MADFVVDISALPDLKIEFTSVLLGGMAIASMCHLCGALVATSYVDQDGACSPQQHHMLWHSAMLQLISQPDGQRALAEKLADLPRLG